MLFLRSASCLPFFSLVLFCYGLAFGFQTGFSKVVWVDAVWNITYDLTGSFVSFSYITSVFRKVCVVIVI